MLHLTGKDPQFILGYARHGIQSAPHAGEENRMPAKREAVNERREMNKLKVWAKSTVNGQRVLLAAKTSIAVGIAWFLAPHMPGVTQEFPYYAPLGALVSMYPTFMASVRTGLQTLAGLVLGILLAAVVLLLGHPNIITISLAVGLGVLLAGVPRLGAGRDYVPVATLLVLIIDGADGVDAFSIGYAVQMAMGVVVGLAVNVTIFPPLTLDVAGSGFRMGAMSSSANLRTPRRRSLSSGRPSMRRGPPVVTCWRIRSVKSAGPSTKPGKVTGPTPAAC